MTFDSYVGGLIFAVSLLLLHGVADNSISTVRYLAQGRKPTPRTWRKISTALICGGILCIALLQVYDRTTPNGIPARFRGDTIATSWTLILLSIFFGQTSLINERHGQKVAFAWLAVMIAGTIALVLIGGLSGRFHPPIFVRP